MAVNFGKTWFTGALPEVWLYALGALFVVVTLFLPRGIVGLWDKVTTGRAKPNQCPLQMRAAGKLEKRHD